MHMDKLHAKLMQAARRTPPADTVPHGFRQRVMARLTASPLEDAWSLWGKALWRAAAVCAAFAVLLGVWSSWTAQDQDLATLEQTVFAAAEEISEIW